MININIPNIFMAYKTLDQYNTSEGLPVIFQAATETAPILIPLILFGLFMITLFSTYFIQRRLTGRGNLAASFAVAGYVVVIAAFVMSLIPNLITTPVLIACIALSIIGTMFLLLAGRD